MKWWPSTATETGRAAWRRSSRDRERGDPALLLLCCTSTPAIAGWLSGSPVHTSRVPSIRVQQTGQLLPTACPGSLSAIARLIESATTRSISACTITAAVPRRRWFSWILVVVRRTSEDVGTGSLVQCDHGSVALAGVRDDPNKPMTVRIQELPAFRQTAESLTTAPFRGDASQGRRCGARDTPWVKSVVKCACFIS